MNGTAFLCLILTGLTQSNLHHCESHHLKFLLVKIDNGMKQSVLLCFA